MEQRTKQDARRLHGCVAHLMQAQLALSSLHARVEAPSAEDRRPMRLIHVGTVLIGVSAAVLVTWLRRHL